MYLVNHCAVFSVNPCVVYVLSKSLCSVLSKSISSVCTLMYSISKSIDQHVKTASQQMPLPFCLLVQSFKDHELQEVLRSPGTADITADVDFNSLAKAAAGKGRCSFTYVHRERREESER